MRSAAATAFFALSTLLMGGALAQDQPDQPDQETLELIKKAYPCGISDPRLPTASRCSDPAKPIWSGPDQYNSGDCCSCEQTGIDGKCYEGKATDCKDAYKTVCSGETPDCVPSKAQNGYYSVCCAKGFVLNDKDECIHPSSAEATSTMCFDGKTTCEAGKQCTVNEIGVEQFGGDGSGFSRRGKALCCKQGEVAINGVCYDGSRPLVACTPGAPPCDQDKREYCATSNKDTKSKCCMGGYYLDDSGTCTFGSSKPAGPQYPCRQGYPGFPECLRQPRL